MPAVYKGDFKGIGELLVSPMIRGAVTKPARKIRAQAEATAPVGNIEDGDTTPGEFKASFRVDAHIRKDRKGAGSRWVADVVSVDPHGVDKELGHLAKNGRWVEGSHTLARAIDAART